MLQMSKSRMLTLLTRCTLPINTVAGGPVIIMIEQNAMVAMGDLIVICGRSPSILTLYKWHGEKIQNITAKELGLGSWLMDVWDHVHQRAAGVNSVHKNDYCVIGANWFAQTC